MNFMANGITQFVVKEKCSVYLRADANGYYLQADLDFSCKVDILDFALFADDWLK